MSTELEPPFDGKPCSMCPIEWRNLYALMHNLANELKYPHKSPRKIQEKWSSISRAAGTVEITPETPRELRDLKAIALRVAKCDTVADLLAILVDIRGAAAFVQPLVDAHFADHFHSHGEIERREEP